MSIKESYYVDTQGPNEDSVRKAIAWLASRPEKHAYIAVAINDNLKGAIQTVIGEKPRKELVKRSGKVTLKGKTISLITKKRMQWSGNDYPIAVFWPSKGFLDDIDSIPSVSAMLVVPQSTTEVQEWITTRNAIELTTGKSLDIVSSISPVVEEALKELDLLVNKETGMKRPSDKGLAVQIFKALQKGGLQYTPYEVKQWLVRNGWSSTNAEEVRDVAEKIIVGRRLRHGENRLGRAPWKRWRKQAGE
jgi:hypothetical protein